LCAILISKFRCEKNDERFSTILQITGHKNIESLNNYADLAEEEEMAMGYVLGRPVAANYNAALHNTTSAETVRNYNL
jgi:hypothetical protein